MFNSRNPLYRQPVGAVPQGQNIHFKITLPRSLNCQEAYLLIERDNEKNLIQDMFWCGMNGNNYEWWECDFSTEQAGVYFYHFELKTYHGRSHLFRGPGGDAVTGGSDRWQITVYEKDFKTPDWLAGGIMYQIFPDRFFRSGKNNQEVPGYRTIHENWNEPPLWRPNEQGDITNDDFFGGDLKGIEEKLLYLKDLGVTCIYCNPIFRAYSNHRYDTGNYAEIDPSLGTEADFTSLCAAAEKLGIHVMIDGVFSHTGSDSLYFNKYGNYDGSGAYQSKDSEYFPWYRFHKWPDQYDCWWGFNTLPNVDECNPSYQEFINGDNGIARKWLRAGSSGWRLDVADELPDAFLDRLHKSVKAENPDAMILGEVWEDASTKTAYGIRRRYLLGQQLDTVMNYPFCEAIFTYLVGGNAGRFFEIIETVTENYPPQCIRLLMNHIGTHDTERAITVLAGEPLYNRGREWQSVQRLTYTQYCTGIKRMKLASLIQYTLPGVPCIYYGDEAGVQGYRDPFNRKTYPWGREDQELLNWYRELGAFRKGKSVLAEGKFRTVLQLGDLIGYERYLDDEDIEDVLLILINRGEKIQLMPENLFPEDAQLLIGHDYRKNDMEFFPYGCAVYSYRQRVKQTADVNYENTTPAGEAIQNPPQTKIQ